MRFPIPGIISAARLVLVRGRKVRALLLIILGIAWPAAAQYSWAALAKVMPSGFVERPYTQMQYSTSYGAPVICQGNDTPPYEPTIYSNDCATGALNATGDTITWTRRFGTEWVNENPSGSPRTVMLAGNLVGDSTPPDRHAYFAINDSVMAWVSGLNSSIRDTISFNPGDVDVGADQITLNRALKWFVNRDVITFNTTFGGLTAGTTYWMIRVSGTVIQVATTSENAAAGTAINITAQPGGDVNMFHVFPGYPPQDIWQFPMSGASWTATQKLQVGSASFSRGDGNYGQATEWWPSMNGFFVQHLRNYELLPTYPWLWNPTSNAMVELPMAGSARNTDEAPQVGGANVMTHSADDDCMNLFGDADTSINFEPFGNDLWRICKTDTVWARMTPVNPRPIRRDNHVFEWIPGTNKFLVFGGNTRVISPPTSTPLNDTWLYDRQINEWDSLEIASPPAAGTQAYGTYVPAWGKMLVQVLLPGGGTNFYTMAIAASGSNPSGLFMIMGGF
jgi:hypothetical protein